MERLLLGPGACPLAGTLLIVSMQVAETGTELWAEGEWMTQTMYCDWLGEREGITDPKKLLGRWNMLRQSPKLKPKISAQGELMLPVITNDKFKFFNKDFESHELNQLRKPEKGLNEEDMGALEEELRSGHARFAETALAQQVGAVEEFAGQFAPSGKGYFSNVKQGDLSQVSWLGNGGGSAPTAGAGGGSGSRWDTSSDGVSSSKNSKASGAPTPAPQTTPLGKEALAAVPPIGAADPGPGAPENEDSMLKMACKRLHLQSTTAQALQKLIADISLEAERLQNEMRLMKLKHPPASRWHGLFQKYWSLCDARLECHKALARADDDPEKQWHAYVANLKHPPVKVELREAGAQPHVAKDLWLCFPLEYREDRQTSLH